METSVAAPPIIIEEKPDPTFFTIALAMQAVFLVLFAIGGEYVRNPNEDGLQFTLFQDINGMLLIGFGFLITFLSRYSYGGLAFNFLLCATCIQWNLIMLGIITQGWRGSPRGQKLGWGRQLRKYSFSMSSLIDADMGTIAILISMGVIFGKVSPSQLLIMALIEVPLYAVNFYIVKHYFRVTDAGGSMTIHVFGCYFGLAVSAILGKPKDADNFATNYYSNLFTMIGTLFLWMYFPSVNCYNAYISGPQESGHHGLLIESTRTRVYVNTILALCASTMAAFIFSKLNNRGTIDIAHIQNASLAGGVAIGACADLYTNPAGAVGIGFVAGVVAVYSLRLYERRFALALYDTRGVNCVHGLPGILGAVASAITIGSYADVSRFHRRMELQAGYQMIGLCISLGIAVVGGLITGLFMKALESPRYPYTDGEHFIVADIRSHYFYGTIRGRPKGVTIHPIK